MSSQIPRDAFRAFTTGCALITTDGTAGPNVMAAEWTFNVSYDPFLILVCIDPENRTHDMILETKEFGVNLVTADQVNEMAFAGHYSKADTDKLSSDLFDTYPAKRIRAPMIRGSLLNAECRLRETIPLGDHMGFLGEVVEFTADPEKGPLVLHHGSHHLGERIARGDRVVLAATPSRVAAGETVTVTGELTASERGGKPVEVSLIGPAAEIVATVKEMTDSGGLFRTRLPLAGSVRHGSYRVVARAMVGTGTARLEVVSR